MPVLPVPGLSDDRERTLQVLENNVKTGTRTLLLRRGSFLYGNESYPFLFTEGSVFLRDSIVCNDCVKVNEISKISAVNHVEF